MTSERAVRGEMVTMTTIVQWLVLAAVVVTVAAQDTREKDRRPQRRRCYTCRSRGEKGDCRDPFVPPEVPEEERRRQTVNTAVAEVPCSTGWCSKIMEGLDKNFGDNDYGIATERQCMERAPSDNQERCAAVQLGHKQVYMCFCKGDLCNPGTRPQAPAWLLAVSLAAVVAVLGR